jgi:hypothetical protein
MVPRDGEERDIGRLKTTELLDSVEKRCDTRVRVVEHVSTVDHPVDIKVNRVVDDLLEDRSEVISPLAKMVLMISEMGIRRMEENGHRCASM